MKTIELQVLENERDWIQKIANTESQKGILIGLQQAISLVEKAQREVQEYEKEVESDPQIDTSYTGQIRSLRTENERLRVALRCYAEALWGWDGEDRPYIDVWPEILYEIDPEFKSHKTGGYVARAALGAYHE